MSTFALQIHSPSARRQEDKQRSQCIAQEVEEKRIVSFLYTFLSRSWKMIIKSEQVSLKEN